VINAYGIFEGGGAKGLAHAGALKAAEENDIRFVGVAGASAGAIIASLIAAGYSADELFNPTYKGKNRVFNADFVRLLGKGRWWFVSKLRWISRSYGKYRLAKFFIVLLGCVMAIVLISAFLTAFLAGFNFLFQQALPAAIGLVAVMVLLVVLLGLLVNLHFPKGVFKSEKFEDWLNTRLCEKLFPGEEPREVQFTDLPTPLKIIVTDIRSRKPVVIDRDNNKNGDSVARAVGHSLSIPFAFRPHFYEDMTFVDGGVLSNFPAWVFDDQRADQQGIVYTIGFRLHNTLEDEEIVKRQPTLRNYLMDLSRVFFGDNALQIREIEDLHLISIKVSASTLDFDLDHDGRTKLFLEGHYAASESFKRFVPGTNEDLVRLYLKTLHDEMYKLLRDEIDGLHLRLNVALPIEPKRRRIRIHYRYNMDDDCDDRLELKINAGAVGRCWQTKKTRDRRYGPGEEFAQRVEYDQIRTGVDQKGAENPDQPSAYAAESG
jgi:NTE family protein